jgi:hypothetical protein
MTWQITLTPEVTEMTKHYRWETTLNARRAIDPGIDDPERRTEARAVREASEVGYRLAELRKAERAAQPSSEGSVAHSSGRSPLG